MYGDILLSHPERIERRERILDKITFFWGNEHISIWQNLFNPLLYTIQVNEINYDSKEYISIREALEEFKIKLQETT